MANVLIVDDDAGIRDLFSAFLTKEGHNAIEAACGLEALSVVGKTPVDIVLLDLKLPDIDGIEILKKIKQINPNIPTIVISGFGSMNTVIKAMKEGAYDFLPKPLDPKYIKIEIAKALLVKDLLTELNSLKVEAKPQTAIISNTPKMQEIFKLIGKTANEKITILIEGESGTGKELVARAIYVNSNRADQPFVPVDCSAIPSTLIEGELFGYEKGAFTGAVNKKIGRFEQADKGIIFLDEISNIPLDIQAKFLRVIQEGEIQRIGSDKPTKIDVRIIAASNRSLEEMAARNEFREDLFHRLNVVKIRIPPLRERKDDIPLLVSHFLSKFLKQHDEVPKRISKEAMGALLQYNWPGNVRELENVLNQAIVVGQGDIIMPEDLNLGAQHDKIGGFPPAENDLKPFPAIGEGILLPNIIEEIETAYIKNALQKTGGNYTQAAKLLGIDRKVLGYKLKKYKIS